MPRFDFRKLLIAYGALCGRWVNDAAPGQLRAAHRRFFKTALALPMFAALAAPAALASGMSIASVFAALAASAGLSLALAAFVSVTRRLNGGLFAVSALAGVSFSLLAPLAGVSAIIPLALLIGGETHFITRKPSDAIAASALAVTVFAALGGLQTAAPSLPIIFGLVSMTLLYLASLLFRTPGAEKLETAPAAQPLAKAVMDAAGIVCAKMRLTGELASVEGPSAECLGVSANLLEGFGLYERIPVGDRLAYLTALDAVRAGESQSETIIKFPGADSALVHVRAAFCRLTDEFLGLSLQRVEAPAAGRALPVTENQVGADRYLAGVSHELRTPLNAILGFSDILKQEMFGALANERQREYVELIHQSGAHLLEVVNMILDVSKLDAGAYQILSEPFDVADAIDVSSAMVRGQAAAKDVDLVCVADKAVSECVGDRRAVQQILINLLSNAVKFTPSGGSVRVDALNEKECLVLKVTDTGIGMCEADLARIGQPFFQAQNDYTRAFEGTGLGLSLVRGLVDLHGGGLAVDSAPGEGTIVTVRLPLRGPSKAGHGKTVNLNDMRLEAAALPLRSGAMGYGANDEPAIRKTA